MAVGEYSTLMAALLICHFLGDFTPLSTARMLEAKRTATSHGWILAHAAIHATLVGLVVTFVANAGLAVIFVAVAVELGTHFAIDEVRARVGVTWSRLGDPKERGFWYAMGVDQLAHGLVLVAIATLVVGSRAAGAA